MEQKFVQRLIRAVLGAALVFLAIWAFFKFVGHNFGSQNIIAFNDNWTVTMDEGTYTKVQMDEFSFPPVRDNEVVTFANTIPEGTPSIAIMEILTYLTTIDVEVDG